MTRQDQIYKWFIYALGLLPVWVLDAFILGRYPLYGTRPALLPLAAVAVAVLEGAGPGARFGLCVGLLWELGYAGGTGGKVLFLALAGALVGSAAQYALTQGFLGCLLCSAATLSVLEGLRVFWGVFSQAAPLSVLAGIAGRELVWTLMWTPLVYLIFYKIFQKVGLDRLA